MRNTAAYMTLQSLPGRPAADAAVRIGGERFGAAVLGIDVFVVRALAIRIVRVAITLLVLRQGLPIIIP